LITSATLAWILVGVFALISIVGIYFSIKFAMIILRIQDTIEESLDIMDERYVSITKVLETPLFYKSPEVQRVLKDIKATRDAILSCAQALTSIDGSEDESHKPEET
jgi:hypothetical protein